MSAGGGGRGRKVCFITESVLLTAVLHLSSSQKGVRIGIQNIKQRESSYISQQFTEVWLLPSRLISQVQLYFCACELYFCGCIALQCRGTNFPNLNAFFFFLKKKVHQNKDLSITFLIKKKKNWRKNWEYVHKPQKPLRAKNKKAARMGSDRMITRYHVDEGEKVKKYDPGGGAWWSEETNDCLTTTRYYWN